MVEKKLYESPLAKFMAFEQQDVITASVTTNVTSDDVFSTGKEFNEWY